MPRAWRPSAKSAAESASPVASARSVSRASPESAAWPGSRNDSPRSGRRTRAAPRIVSVTPSKALTTTTGRRPAASWRATTSTAAAMSSGRRRTEPPNLSTTTPDDDARVTLPASGRGRLVGQAHLAARQGAAGTHDPGQLVQRADDARVGRLRLAIGRDADSLGSV